jgi:hypothetical protein
MFFFLQVSISFFVTLFISTTPTAYYKLLHEILYDKHTNPIHNHIDHDQNNLDLLHCRILPEDLLGKDILSTSSPDHDNPDHRNNPTSSWHPRGSNN